MAGMVMTFSPLVTGTVCVTLSIVTVAVPFWPSGTFTTTSTSLPSGVSLTSTVTSLGASAFAWKSADVELDAYLSSPRYVTAAV